MKKSQRLSEKLFNLQSFKQNYKSLLISSVIDEIPCLIRNSEFENIENSIDWKNILMIGNIFSQVESGKFQEISLRIAQYCLRSNLTNETQKMSAYTILENISNKPSIKLCQKRGYLEETDRLELPVPLIFNRNKTEIENSILSNNKLLSLNPFQKEFYDTAFEYNYVSVSAPTAAGKSYILLQFLFDYIQSNEVLNNIVFIVPTRALISQVEEDLKTSITNNTYENIFISTIPEKIPNDGNCIYIFTQERLHWFRTKNPEVQLDLIIVDEAHKISDSTRGILLQEKLQDCVNDFPSIRILFSSPFTSNPETLLDFNVNHAKQKSLSSDYSTVNQNLLFINSTYGKPKEWSFDVQTLEGELINIGKLVFENRPSDETKKMLFIVMSVSKSKGGALIYANRAYDAEQYAIKLYSFLDESDNNKIDIALLNLIELIKSTINPKYQLLTTLKKGVAFHYGNMPLLVRNQIEQLFKRGIIKYLICTSTLMEGVNLPAKSIFIRKPKRGSRNHLTQSDFWNLAGRAGRWGKEFQGNIVCIEPETWIEKPDINNKKLPIKRAIDSVNDKWQDLISFIKKDTPRDMVQNNFDLESAFSYYYNYFLDNKLPDILNDDLKSKELINIFSEIKKSIQIPDIILKNNPGISPIAIQTLYNYFSEYGKDPMNLIPVTPETENAATDSYLHIVGRISTHLSGDPYQLNYTRAILVVDWMRGMPLSVLISKSYKYWKKKNNRTNIHKVIRDTMKEVEEYARFKFAKYSSCYIDLLKFYFSNSGQSNLIELIPEINIWIEFGVSQRTQLSLIGLGLSRSTSIILSQFISNDELDQNQVLEWIKNNNINDYDVSEIIKEEIGAKIAI